MAALAAPCCPLPGSYRVDPTCLAGSWKAVDQAPLSPAVGYLRDCIWQLNYSGGGPGSASGSRRESAGSSRRRSNSTDSMRTEFSVETQPAWSTEPEFRSSRSLLPASIKEERPILGAYSLADSFDSFRGALFCNTATKWRPDFGIWTFPPNTISLAVSLRP